VAPNPEPDKSQEEGVVKKEVMFVQEGLFICESSEDSP
jgi:hypothetical protein